MAHRLKHSVFDEVGNGDGHDGGNGDGVDQSVRWNKAAQATVQKWGYKSKISERKTEKLQESSKCIQMCDEMMPTTSWFDDAMVKEVCEGVVESFTEIVLRI